MEVKPTNTIGELVNQHYKTAEVFKSFGIDFCCGGKKTLGEHCLEARLDFNRIKQDLENAMQTGKTGVDYSGFDTSLLIDLIVHKHHHYVRKSIPDLTAYLFKTASVHGKAHPELLRVRSVFSEMAESLLDHMEQEEEVLFPLLRSKGKAGNENITMLLNSMLADHDAEGERIRQLLHITNHFTPPENACNTYRLSYNLLNAFTDDLYMHIHAENNVLFPRFGA